MGKEKRQLSWEELETKYRKRIKRLHRMNGVIFWVTLALAVINVGMLLVRDNSTWEEIVFRGGQYLAMLLILKAPIFCGSGSRWMCPPPCQWSSCSSPSPP